VGDIKITEDQNELAKICTHGGSLVCVVCCRTSS
jgi:hypothetical protein